MMSILIYRYNAYNTMKNNIIIRDGNILIVIWSKYIEQIMNATTRFMS